MPLLRYLKYSNRHIDDRKNANRRVDPPKEHACPRPDSGHIRNLLDFFQMFTHHTDLHETETTGKQQASLFLAQYDDDFALFCPQ